MTFDDASPTRSRIVALVGIVLVALNLRTAVAAISPIVDRISVDVPLDPVVVGVIGAAPPLAFAASGLLGPLVARRLGLDGALVAAIAVMVVGHLGRALAPSGSVLVLATVVTLVGVGVTNVLLPPVVKRAFPERVGAVTALYATLMSIGATLPALVAVPVADTAGWRASLGLWFVSSVVVAVPWVVALRDRRSAAHDRAEAEAEAGEVEPVLELRLRGSRVAWAMAGMFAATSVSAYAFFAWLPSLLVDTAGVGDAEAGILLGVYAFMGFPAAIVVPLLAARLRSIAPVIALGLALLLAGDLGLLLAPAAAPLLWTVLAGLGPLLFPLALALIGLRSRTHRGAVALSGFVQGLGYTVGAAGPFVVGLLHQLTGGWTAPLVFLLAIVLVGSPAVVVLARPRFVEDELAR